MGLEDCHRLAPETVATLAFLHHNLLDPSNWSIRVERVAHKSEEIAGDHMIRILRHEKCRIPAREQAEEGSVELLARRGE